MQPPEPLPIPKHDRDALIWAVLEGYRVGAFPMAIDDIDTNEQWGGHPARPALAWYEADPRGIIHLDPPGYHIPRRLVRTMNSSRFEITSDQAFGRVIRACADPRREGAWINSEIIALFEILHAAGHAHSVEAWLPLDADAEPCEASDPTAPDPDAILLDPAHSRILVGGLYGLCVGSIFCGEAMFSRPDLGGRDASKVCLVRTILHLRAQGFTLLDTQMPSDHLAQFGCEPTTREAYHDILLTARDTPRDWGTFS